MFATLLAGASSIVALVADAVQTPAALDLSSVDFSPIVNSINSAVPSVLTAIIPIVGVRKVISFVMGAVKGA
jgi:hypothetical protein